MPQPIRDGIRRLFHLEPRRIPELHHDIDDELRFHLDARIEQLMHHGLTPSAARAEALRRLGAPLDQMRDTLRHSAEQREHTMATREGLDQLFHDITYAARGLRQRPLFTAVAVLTLAIGIGANTAIFSAVDALLLRPLPFRDPGQLMDVVQRTPFDPANGGSGDAPWSYPKFMTFATAQHSYSAVALDARETFILAGDQPERITGERVSGGFLATLGVPVAVGRDFPANIDAHAGGPKLAILGNDLWQRRFRADPAIIGQLIRVDSSSYQVIGVLPAGFHGMSGKAELLVPVTARIGDELNAWDLEFSLVARLKPGVTPAQADADARRVAPIVYQATPQKEQTITSGPGGTWGAAAHTLNSVRVAPALRQSLLVLFGAVGMVLLIACVNLANLLLGRATTRRQEIAIRLAIGAGRGRLVRLLLCESVLLSLLGGVASVVLAAAGTQWLRRLNPDTALQAQQLSGSVGAVSFEQVHLDLRALTFTFLVTVIVGVVFGLFPAIQATRTDLITRLKDGTAGAGRGAGVGMSRRVLVVTEVALALVLLAGSGLMLRSLANTIAIDPGFVSDHELTLRLTIPVGSVAKDSMPGFYQQLQDRLAAVPGVKQVSLIDCPPLNGGCNGTLMTFPDRPASNTGNAIVGVHWATPSWFSALRVPLRKGRMFDATDRNGSPKVVLISETAARKFWPGQDPLGKPVKVWQGGFQSGATVIGVVGDVRFATVDSLPGPDVYISYSQAYTPRMMIFLRTTGDPLALVPSVRAALHESEPQDPVYDIASMDQRVGAASAQARLSAILLGFFAAVALGLAAIGIYGVMAFGVAQRVREIGIRMALGAGRERVIAMVLREGVMMATIGTGLGVVAALLLTRLLRSMLFQVAPGDPPVYIAMIGVVVVATLLASWIPARQAARVDPTEALRKG